MTQSKDKVKGFVATAFLLLGALFGMIIMSFIFAQIGPTQASISDDTITVTNETGAHLNITTYTVDNSADPGFANLIITGGLNATDGTLISAANFTVSGSGFTNATVLNYAAVTVSYTYTRWSDVRLASRSVQNNSLQSLVNYTDQADSQFTTLGIAITLIILILLFLVFWNIFIRDKGKGKGSSFG